MPHQDAATVIIALAITGLSHAGEGIGRHEGRAVFVPFALPGETVRAEIVAERKTFARARLLEVLTPTPQRVTPPCPHHFDPARPRPEAEVCGGCQLQHMPYPAQLAFKEQTVRDQFRRVGGLTDPPVRPALPAPEPFRYRNQAQFSLTSEGRLGFRAAFSHHTVPIQECRLLQPALADLWPQIVIEPEAALQLERVTLRAGAEGEALVELEAAGEAPALELDLPVSVVLLAPDRPAAVLAGSDHLLERVRGRTFVVSAGAFFQVNPALVEALLDLVLGALRPQADETVLDLYCGVGLFSAFIAPRAARVIGVEAYEPAVEDFAANLDEFDNVEVYAASAEAALPELGGGYQAVVLDPPRAGCAPAVLEALILSRAARLVYVSCDPATLARDARRLVEGGFRLEWVQPLDMFPQTHHIECVARFSRPAA